MRRWYSRVRRSCSAKPAVATPRQPRPRSAASSSVPGLVTVTHIGGCGFWSGFGSTARSGIEKQRPWWEKRSRIHICGSTRTYSSQSFLVASGSAWKPPISVHVEERAVPNSSRPPESTSRKAARSATRIGWLICGTHTTAPCPTRMRRVCAAMAVRKSSGAEEWEYSSRKWCSTAQARLEAELVGQPRLLERVLEHRAARASALNGRGTESSKKTPNFISTPAFAASHPRCPASAGATPREPSLRSARRTGTRRCCAAAGGRSGRAASRSAAARSSAIPSGARGSGRSRRRRRGARW